MDGGPIEQLAALTDELADLDLGALDDAELHDLTIALHRLHDRLGLAAAHALARWEQRGVWAGDQSRTPSGRPSLELRCSPRSAQAALRRSRQLAHLPLTVEAVRAGTLSPDHIALLAGAQAASAERFADDESTLIEHCHGLCFDDAERVVAYWKLHVAPDDVTPDDAAEAATAHASETLDGTVIIDARLDPLGGATVLGELQRLADQIRLADARDGITRTAARRRAAALVEMATRSAATPAGAQRPRPLFTVLVGDESLTKLCELAAGRIVAPGALVAHVDTAVLETVLFDGHDTVVTVSRRRAFTGAIRRAIEVRDRHCQHPSGCDVPADRCDVDHIIPWPQSQRTDQGNGRLECPTHNRHPDRHDTDAVPGPVRIITGLDAGRARARWWCSHQRRTDPDTDDADSRLAG